MYFKQEIGNIGENIAIKYLKKSDYAIVEKNFKCKMGEVDIIAYDRKQHELIFIEVKTRTSLKYGRPGEAVQKRKQEHIKRVGQYFIVKNRIKKQAVRFDVIEIYLSNSSYKIEHIKQAFI